MEARVRFPARTDHARVTTMKRLDQGHLYPELEVPGLTSQPGIKHEPLEQLVNSYSEHLHMSATSGECSRPGSPKCMCYMNTHELH